MLGGPDRSSVFSMSLSGWNGGKSAWLALAASSLRNQELGDGPGRVRVCVCVEHIPHLGFPALTLLTKLVLAPLDAHLNELRY